jgi:hypothetical protein
MIQQTFNNSCEKAELLKKVPMETTGGISSMLANMNPDTVVINSGLWTVFTSSKCHTLAKLFEDYVKNRGLVVYWKTTTATKQADKLILDEESKKIFPSYNWRIFDAYKLTKPLVEYETNLGNSTQKIPVMWDKIHFYDWVYRGLNEVLLVDILKG